MQLTRNHVVAIAAALAAMVGCSDHGEARIDAPPPVDGAPDAPPDAPIDARPDAPGLCDNETRDDDYIAGMSRTGVNGFGVVLVNSTPPPAAKGNYTWTVQVLDPAMSPRDGLTIAVFPFMPDHGHGTAVQAIVTPSGANGMYSISPINLFMTGLWSIRLGLRDGNTELDAIVYWFCVD